MQDRTLNNRELTLLTAIQEGFPLTSRPFQQIGQKVGWSEDEVISGLSDLQNRGIIKRMGVIVRHRELGFKANAMVVWDVPEDQVSRLGKKISQLDFVTLCYHRRRSLPRWPYNLYCMIHGRERDQVLKSIDSLEGYCGMKDIPKQVLFSLRRFKQQGAHYFQPSSKRS
ncbi:MAG: AsnC family protein [Magnetococcales bacterium]|nr:AsnC family protein [Magnetococcales bacterium]